MTKSKNKPPLMKSGDSMRIRLRSKVHDGKYCSCCEEPALYVMEIKVRNFVQIIRFCQRHMDELRTMLRLKK